MSEKPCTGLISQPFRPKMSFSRICIPTQSLERRRNAEPERLTRFLQLVLRSQALQCLPESEVAGRACGEHGARDEVSAAGQSVHPQRVISVVDAEGSIDHRQHDLQLQTGG